MFKAIFILQVTNSILIFENSKIKIRWIIRWFENCWKKKMLFICFPSEWKFNYFLHIFPNGVATYIIDTSIT